MQTVIAAGLVTDDAVLERCRLLPAGPARDAAVALAERIAEETSTS